MTYFKRGLCLAFALILLLQSVTQSQSVREETLKEMTFQEVKNLFNQAVMAGDVEICRTILDSGRYYVNDIGKADQPPLFYAACSGQSEICRLLLEHGANPVIENMRESSLTPLEAAIANDHTETAILLINASESQSFQSRKGRNKPALFLAIANENPDIVKALIAKGADVNAPNDCDGIVQTPLYFASLTKNRDICRLLLDAGANVNFKQGKIQSGDALFIAALTGEEQVCRFWFDAEVRLDTQDSATGMTLLNYVLHYASGVSPVVEVDIFQQPRSLFMVHGPYRKFTKFVPEKNMMDAFNKTHVALDDDLPDDESDEAPEAVQENATPNQLSTYAVCKFLLDAGCDVDLRDKEGCSPFEILILTQMNRDLYPAEDFQALLQLLLDSKADMLARDQNGWTPLHYLLFAILQDESRLIPKSKKPTPNEEETADRKMALLQKLIDAGADPTVVDKQGNTLLHYAISSPAKTARKGEMVLATDYEISRNDQVFCRKLIAMLIEKGVSPSAENCHGETPFDWSRGSIQGKPSGSGSSNSSRMSPMAPSLQTSPSPFNGNQYSGKGNSSISETEAVDQLMGGW